VIKVSEAVSGEIVLDRLIDTIMRTALEHAGAERGLLILSRGRVAGRSGAAAKLGVPASTLDDRIKALGIDKTQFKFR